MRETKARFPAVQLSRLLHEQPLGSDHPLSSAVSERNALAQRREASPVDGNDTCLGHKADLSLSNLPLQPMSVVHSKGRIAAALLTHAMMLGLRFCRQRRPAMPARPSSVREAGSGTAVVS